MPTPTSKFSQGSFALAISIWIISEVAQYIWGNEKVGAIHFLVSHHLMDGIIILAWVIFFYALLNEMYKKLNTSHVDISTLTIDTDSQTYRDNDLNMYCPACINKDKKQLLNCSRFDHGSSQRSFECPSCHQKYDCSVSTFNQSFKSSNKDHFENDPIDISQFR